MESYINNEIEDFSDGPVAKTLVLIQELRVRSLVRKLCAATKSSVCVCTCVCARARSVMSNSPLYDPGTVASARLLCLWDFPGKNTGVVVISFSRGSSWPRDQTQVSCVPWKSSHAPTKDPACHKKTEDSVCHS